jgi:CDP-diacylglycerol---glycerol-3-phosphate 3-phosphatidyltransferase
MLPPVAALMSAPMVVTASRIAAIPPLMVLLLVDEIPGARWWALGLFVAAAMTDSLDGWLARSRGQVTVAGVFLDSLADKVLVTAVLLCLIETGEVPAWVAMVIIAREFAVTGLRLVAAGEDLIIPASRFGKLKAFSQNVALGVIIVPITPRWVENLFLGIALVMTVLSGAYYFLMTWPRLFAGKSADPEAAADR